MHPILQPDPPALLELQASKGDMDREEARRVRRTLLAGLVGSGRKAQHTREQNGAQGHGQGGARVLPEGPLSRDPGLAGFQDRPEEDNTTAGLHPAE